MSRIIINNNTDLSDDVVLSLVASVIAGGRISNEGRQYPYHTELTVRFNDTELPNRTVDVLAGLTQTGNDTFLVTDVQYHPLPAARAGQD